MSVPVLEARRIVKSFGGVRALRGVSLAVHAGEVLAVIGENGAGKSTLMKILAGVQGPDTGELIVDGQVRAIRSVQEALSLGIALIHQELNLAETLDVGANIYLGREPQRMGWIDSGRINRESRVVLEQVGLAVSPETLVSELTIGQQQLVEIAKALSVKARVLIMDEPTSSLSGYEAQNLLRLIRELRSRGVAIVYISHRLGEVHGLADRVEVLRDGENAGQLAGGEISHPAMVRLMVGRELSQFYPHKVHPSGAAVLEVEGLRTRAHPRHAVNFQVRAGEVVGMAGLVGAGRTEVLEALFGITPALAGAVRVDGRALAAESPRAAMDAGLALVPEDRKHDGLVLEMGVRENISLATLHRDQRRGFLNRQQERALCEEMVGAMRIKTPNAEQPVQFLSGGNQQKVVIGKWLATRPRVLLLDEPTRGVDIGAKQEIYLLMEELASKGVAVLFVSSDLEEILGMSDRVLVLHEGRLAGELSRGELSEEAVMHLATGAGPRSSHPVPVS
jgi:ribose transport system ATP-binding protein